MIHHSGKSGMHKIILLTIGSTKCKINRPIGYFQALLCFYTSIFKYTVTKVFKVIMQLSFHLAKSSDVPRGITGYVPRELSRGVTTLTIAKVPQRDHRVYTYRELS